jgi:rhodanese-related sulfurtransferase
MDGEITVEELQSLLDEDGDGEGPRIVDIRNPDAFARGHIPGSENVPAPELTDRVEELDGADRVVTVCPHGEASVQAARLVAAYEGVDGPVESLRGGITAWEGPLEPSNDGRATAGQSTGTDADDSPAPF